MDATYAFLAVVTVILAGALSIAFWCSHRTLRKDDAVDRAIEAAVLLARRELRDRFEKGFLR